MAEPTLVVSNDPNGEVNTETDRELEPQGTGFDDKISDPTNTVYGSFFLADEEFAMAACELVDVINSPEAFTPQPLSPDYLLGIMTLRDMTIPVIDLRRMFNLPPINGKSAQQKIAITQYENHHIGLMFDQTSEVFRSTRHDCVYNQYTATTAGGVTNGAFRLEGGARIVQLLNTQAIIERNGNPFTRTQNLTNDQTSAQAQIAKGSKRQSIVFHLEPLMLSISMSNVQEVLLVEEFDNLSLASEVLAGTTTIRGTTIPIFNLRAVLKLPARTDSTSDLRGRIIVSHSNDRTFGLLVDDISDILHHYDEDIQNFPVFVAENAEIFLGCLKGDENEEIIQLDIDKIFSFEEIGEALENCDHLFAQQTQLVEKAVEASQTQTFLTFHIDRLYGLNILEISEVVDYPEKLLQPPMLGQHIDGILSLRDEMINVVNAAQLYNIEGAPEKTEQIIILKSDTERFGLAISSINSIIHLNQQQQKKLPETMIDRQLLVFEDAENALVFKKSDERGIQDIIILDHSSVVSRLKNH